MSKIVKNLLDKVYAEKNCSQIILVTSEVEKTDHAKLQCYEKVGVEWKSVFCEMKARIGENGFTENKVEGDRKTPMGGYSFSVFFGSGEDLGFKFPYKKVDGNQVWVDDVESGFYNTWQEKCSQNLWNSAENLLQPAYTYAAVIDYNTEVIKGKGSAIFFHKINTGSTAGCIALCEEELIRVLKWLDPSKKPLIVQGTYNYLNKIFENMRFL